MKLLAALLATAILGAGLPACGNAPANTPARAISNANGSTSSGSGTNSSSGKDRDNDNDHNNDDEGTLAYGHVANAADSQAITALIKRYFADAAAEAGAKACTLLTPFVAETVAEVNGHTSALRGKTCAIVMTKLFKQHHRALLGKRANLKTIRVGVEGNKALVALGFPEIPEVRQIAMRRVNNRWTVLELLDGIIE